MEHRSLAALENVSNGGKRELRAGDVIARNQRLNIHSGEPYVGVIEYKMFILDPMRTEQFYMQTVSIPIYEDRLCWKESASVCHWKLLIHERS